MKTIELYQKIIRMPDSWTPLFLKEARSSVQGRYRTLVSGFYDYGMPWGPFFLNRFFDR
jgi:hypothetical protein